MFLKPTKDFFIRGVIAGVIAGTLKDIPDILLVDLFKVKQLAFWDYVGEILFNKIPYTFMEHLTAFLVQVVFSIGIGVIYTSIVARFLPTKHHFIRGLLYGGFCWIILTSTVKLYNITSLLTKGLISPLLTLLFSVGYGLLIAYVDEYLKAETENKIF
jgi:hypothetical protein